MGVVYCKDEKMLDMACFFLRILGFDTEKFEIDISLKKLKSDEGAYCASLNDSYTSFYIELPIPQVNGISIEQVEELLAHELVHVTQYIKGDLRNISEHETLWKGKVYKEPKTALEYYTCPWEIEAYGLQRGLISLWEKEHS